MAKISLNLDERSVKNGMAHIRIRINAAQQQRISELEQDKQLLQGLLSAFTKK